MLGILLMMFSATMLTPLVVNVFFREHFWQPFVAAFFCTFCSGLLLWFPFRRAFHELKARDGFLIVALFWFVLCGFAALPFLFTFGDGNNGVIDAFFESVSGFTTTGASILPHLDSLPHAVLFYRQQLQFLGGMGIVVLAVAILPMLGVGGMQLYRAETPGPMKDAKLTPRIAQTAKALWLLYVSLTALCAVCYWLAGMHWFDAIGESFSTVSTGGFSMHDTSFSYYASPLIESVACLFMFLGGTSFVLHFSAFRSKNILLYWRDEEFRIYVGFLSIAVFIVVGYLWAYNYYEAPKFAVIKSLFNVISLATTTGFLSAPFSQWPTFVPMLITLLAIIGGCAASTSGGIKVIRALLIFKQSKREMTRLIHPSAVVNIKFGRHTLPEPVLQSMWGFISVYIASFVILFLLFTAFGNNTDSSLALVTASLANAGAGIGSIADNFSQLNDASKATFIFAMLAGRLEIFSLIILFSPDFWQK